MSAKHSGGFGGKRVGGPLRRGFCRWPSERGSRARHFSVTHVSFSTRALPAITGPFLTERIAAVHGDCVSTGVSCSLRTEERRHGRGVDQVCNEPQTGWLTEDVQYLAGHAEPRTTGLYDRRQKKVTRNIVERISI